MTRKSLAMVFIVAMMTGGCGLVNASQGEEVARELLTMQQGKQPQRAYCIAADGFLNIREAPSAKSQIIGCLTTGGEGAVVLGKSGNWLKVDYYGIVGYVNKSFVSYQKPKNLEPKYRGKVYYVVVDSHPDFLSAKQHAEMFDIVFAVYRVMIDGKTTFRCVDGCYKSLQDAENYLSMLREIGKDGWIWESKGLAHCIYRPIMGNGEPVPVMPK